MRYEPRDADEARVLENVVAWARQVRGAPRRFIDIVTRIEVDDTLLRRAATRIEQRALREVSAPSPSQLTCEPLVRSTDVDPFAHTLESLKDATRYVATCVECDGAREQSCWKCSGTGVALCSQCRGTGRQRSEKTGRLIQCKKCRTKGTERCETCNVTGRAPCKRCRGSGCQERWWVYDETSHWVLGLESQPGGVRLPEKFAENCALSERDLAEFATIQAVEGEGAVADRLSGEDASFVRASASAQGRTQRIGFQQFLKLAVRRRIVKYEMAGTEGTVEATGNDWVVAVTPTSQGPMARRRAAWWAVAVGVALIAVLAVLPFLGRSEYLWSVSTRLLGIAGLGAVLIGMASGAVLRALRRGKPLGPIHPHENAAALCGLVLVLCAMGYGVATRPSRDKVVALLAEGDVAGARLLIDAVREKDEESPEVLELEDEVVFAQAGDAQGADRVALLEAVASGGRSLASRSAEQLRELRLNELRGLVASRDARGALFHAGQWFAGEPAGGEISELRAQAYEQLADACSDEGCRYAAARGAVRAQASSARSARAQVARAQLMALLAAPIDDAPPEPVLAAAGRLEGLGQTVFSELSDDAELVAAARKATEAVRLRRQSIAVIGARRELVQALFGFPSSADPIVSKVVEGGQLFAAFDAAGLCKGVYLSTSGGSTAIRHGFAAEVIGQSVGSAATVVAAAPSGVATDRRTYGRIPVVERWLNGALREVRIGEATP